MTSPSRPLTVSELNTRVRDLLEGTFPRVWVEGELSNLARPASGHLYFTLKDQRAQVRCAMFRGQNQYLAFAPRDGHQVSVRATVSLYPLRGDYQLIVDHMEEAGEGALRRAFETLKRKLEAEGLFAPERKRPLPRFPACIGLVTSPGGAAVRDLLSVLGSRAPGIPVVIYPVAVQGAGAVADLVHALAIADRRRDCDVLVVARGGGSLEDLQAFNDEKVARAIAACRLPVVTGVGHEVDVTIADFVADRRAETPSAAAAAVSPDRREWRQRVAQLTGRLARVMAARLEGRRQRLVLVGARLRHPRQRLRDHAQLLDALTGRLGLATEGRLRRHAQRLELARTRLLGASPARRLTAAQRELAAAQRRLAAAWSRQQAARRATLASAARSLDAVSPLATLDRGYAVVSRQADGQLVRAIADAPPGTRVRARLGDGTLGCRVDTATPRPRAAAASGEE